MNFILSAIPSTLNREEIRSQLAIRAGTRSEAILENILDNVEMLARPKAIYRASYIEKSDYDTVTVEDTVFHSTAMRRNLEDVGRIFPFIATCGTEVENTPIDRDDAIQRTWLSMIKLVLLRSTIETLREAIRDQYRLETLSTMNPGSAEAGVWPIEEQRPLFDLFGGPELVEQATGVRLLPSLFMSPDMSASGIMFPSDTTYFNCQLCQRQDCPSRKAPFDAALWETIHSS